MEPGADLQPASGRFPLNDESMRISYEAIYQALYVESRGALKRELVACLRSGRALRAPRARARRKPWAHVTPEVMISERPAEVEDRAIPGHCEGDLVIGLKRSAIGTLVERTTRFTMLIHLPREDGYGIISRTKNGPALAGYASPGHVTPEVMISERAEVEDRANDCEGDLVIGLKRSAIGTSAPRGSRC